MTTNTPSPTRATSHQGIREAEKPRASRRAALRSMPGPRSGLVLDEPLIGELVEGPVGLHRRDGRVEGLNEIGALLEDEAVGVVADGVADRLVEAGGGAEEALARA